MSENIVLRILLFPVSVLYGSVIALRNLLYRYGMLKSVRFNIPVISVGNLSVGGTGKTPHTAHILRYLSSYIPVATMSRGYGRKTRGFKVVQTSHLAENVGDESLLMKFKFPHVLVAVNEDRATGVPKLMGYAPNTKAILLDDAFQHRAVDPYINILLTCYDTPYTRDWMIPTGRLREWPASHKRADCIIVTKCPDTLTQQERTDMIDLLKVGDRPVFFTKYIYAKPYLLFNNQVRLELNEETEVILLSGIAGTDYLLRYLSPRVQQVHNYAFRDHHDFSARDIGQLELMFSEMIADKKAIICTEKDAVRLIKHRKYLIEKNLPVFVLPVDVEFLFNQVDEFNQYISNRLLEFRV